MECGNVVVLAEHPGLGRVWDCGECGNIHVSVGPVTLRLDPPAYLQLVAMLNASAANFETWLDDCHRVATEFEQRHRPFRTDDGEATSSDGSL